MLVFSHMQISNGFSTDLLLLVHCMCLTVLHVSLHLSICLCMCPECSNLVCLPGQSFNGGATGLFETGGGQVMTLNQVSLFFEKMCGIFDLS